MLTKNWVEKLLYIFIFGEGMIMIRTEDFKNFTVCRKHSTKMDVRYFEINKNSKTLKVTQ